MRLLLAIVALASLCGCGDTGPGLSWEDSGAVATDTPDTSPEGLSAEERVRRQALLDASLPALEALAADAILVKAVRAANADSERSEAEILELDRQWRATSGTDDPLIERYLQNPCADFLRARREERSDWAELFVMDDQGCLVATSDKTSDFWQGDEAKWQESFHGGDGRIHYGRFELDDSTRSYVLQISVPVRDAAGATIGVLTASVRVGS